MNLRTLAAVSIGAITSGLVGAGAAVAVIDPQPGARVNNPILTRGCVIRFDEKTSSGATKPTRHMNSSHYCVGINREPQVEADGDLVLHMDGGEPIVSIMVSPDESLTKLGIDCGASGGTGQTTIRCYDRTGRFVRADSPQMFGALNNLWIGWTSWETSL